MSVGMLPSAIEDIFCTERPQGGYLAEMGGSTAALASFAPGAETTVYLRPPESRFALILFWAQVTPWQVPDTLTAHFQHDGHGIYGANWSAQPIDSGVPGWAVVTDEAPLVAHVQNTSNLTQRVELGYLYGVIYSRADYDMIRQLLKDRIGQGLERRAICSLIDRLEAAQVATPMPVYR